MGDGRIIEPYYVMETMDWVHIVALTEAEELLLVRQYRQAQGVFCLELPGGLHDRAEPHLETARRELGEEVGATARAWHEIAVQFPDPARQANRLYTFLAEGVSIQTSQDLDATEELEIVRVPLAQIEAHIASGEFSQSTQIASLYLTLRWLERRRASYSPNGA